MGNNGSSGDVCSDDVSVSKSGEYGEGGEMPLST